MKKLPASERPRERLVRLGESSLSLTELLAIVLGSGTQEKPVLELAQEIVERFPTLDATLPELLQVKGIGKVKAIQLKAALAIGKRIHATQEENPILDHPQKVYELIKEEMNHPQERVMVLLLDTKRRLIHKEILFIGTLSEVLLHPREIFHLAIRNKASSIILAHNHPSGDPTPSKRDIEMTKQMHEVAKVVGIPLLDHLILGRGRFASLASQGHT